MEETKEGLPTANAGSAGKEPNQPDLGLATLPPPPFRAPVHNIFVGDHGLRAGWRFLLYVALWRVFLVLITTVVRYAQPHEAHGIWRDLIAELEFLASALLPALVMAAIEKRSFSDYGLPRRRAFGKSFWMGVVWGIVAISFLVLAIGGVGDFSLGSLALHGARILKFAAFWGGFFLIVSLFEEFLLRGYPQFTLTQGMGFWPAAILLSGLFAVLHLDNPGETWTGLLAVAAIGLFLCLTLRRTGTLWFAVGFHASWDWGESFLYSVPDSGGMVTGHLMRSSFHGSRWITGGSVGPEGSVLVFVVIALTWVTFDRAYPGVKYGA
ncbi:MAG: type II CAAX endopeptidase family protein [Terriglobales bacterium]